MQIDNKDFSEQIYSLLNGYLSNPEQIPESQFVQDAFSSGSICFHAYGNVLDAYERLCRRLDPRQQDDPDVEIMLNNMNVITHYLCIKMFEYGVFFARREGLQDTNTLKAGSQ